MRLFIAADLDDAARARVAELQERLRPLVRGAKWVPAENIHLTLKFLGEVPDDRVPEMAGSLAAAGVRHAATPIAFDRLGTFPRILWLGGDAPALASLAADLGESRPFRAHLTLARFRDRAPKAPRLPFEPVATTISTICLYQSVLGGGPAKYVTISRTALSLSVEKT